MYIKKTLYKLVKILKKYNFKDIKTKIIVKSEDNYKFLQYNEDHVATDVKETFYLDEKEEFILRPHNTVFWLDVYKLIKKNKEYFDDNSFFNNNFMSYGPVFRKNDSSRHFYTFHQVDLLINMNNRTISDCLQFICSLISLLFIKKPLFRVRKSFFPFTNNSHEIDIWYNNKWVELLGCGTVKKDILNTKCDFFAAGIGIERITMIKYKIDNIKTLIFTS